MPTITDINAPVRENIRPNGSRIAVQELVPPPRAIAQQLKTRVPGDRSPLIGGPHCLHVRLTRGGTVRPHFHRMDQWQVFLSGSAYLGKQHVEAITVLYTQRFTPYGPIVAGEQGLEYFDLHADSDWGSSGGNSQHMPEDRAQLERKAGRVHAIRLDPNRAVLNEHRGVELQPLLELAEDGTAAWRLRAGPRATLHGTLQKNSAGQWYCVIDGSAVLDGTAFPRGAGFFVAPVEGVPRFSAGECGLDLVVVQYGAGKDRRPILSTFRGLVATRAAAG